MPLPRRSVIGIMVDNLARRGSVLPLSKRAATGWARGLGIPRGGETVLYTGQMYQLIPTISVMAARMAAFEDSWITRFMEVGRVLNRVVNVSSLIGRAKQSEQDAYDHTLRSIARLLQAAGVAFGYLYDQELYSGALVHDQGLDGALARHAGRVREVLRSHGVKRVITVDPHTTYMLRHVYPKTLGDFDVEVRSYLEVLAERELPLKRALNREVAVHDSCVYARYEDIVDQPRLLLQRAGAAVSAPETSGRRTQCCGGPIESLFPARAHAIARKRAAQLSALKCGVATMCPICLVNLKGAASGDGVVYRDLADVLAEAFLDRPGVAGDAPEEG
jgi:Fe-S oxidoreductase